MTQPRYALAAAVAAVLLASATPAVAAPVTGRITVSAASSLTDAFPALAKGFTRAYPGVRVTFNFAGSSALVAQVDAGAPVDVIATASQRTMQPLVDAKLVRTPVVFAGNALRVIVPAANTAGIKTIKDLAKPNLRVAICAASVPCGAAAMQLFVRNNVRVTPATLELEVRSVLGKVVADEVDAGVVYATDAAAAGKRVKVIAVPAQRNVTTKYPIAVVAASSNVVTAKAFVAYVRSDAGQKILRAHGFSRA